MRIVFPTVQISRVCVRGLRRATDGGIPEKTLGKRGGDVILLGDGGRQRV